MHIFNKAKTLHQVLLTWSQLSCKQLTWSVYIYDERGLIDEHFTGRFHSSPGTGDQVCKIAPQRSGKRKSKQSRTYFRCLRKSSIFTRWKFHQINFPSEQPNLEYITSFTDIRKLSISFQYTIAIRKLQIVGQDIKYHTFNDIHLNK